MNCFGTSITTGFVSHPFQIPDRNLGKLIMSEVIIDFYLVKSLIKEYNHVTHVGFKERIEVSCVQWIGRQS